MFTFQNLKALLFLAASLLALQSSAAAQSGRKHPPLLSPPTPPTQPAPAPMPIDTANFEKIKLIVSRGLDDFIRDLNDLGRLGYRVEKTVSYGNADEGRKYAALLRLDPGHTYEYIHDQMPEDLLNGHPLDYYARRGYQLAGAYAVATCLPVDYDFYRRNRTLDPSNSPIMKQLFTDKNNGFLLMRRDMAAEQTKGYQIFTGQVGLGDNLREKVQTAIDDAPPGFRPVRLLFSGSGLLGSFVSVVLEKDLNGSTPARGEYQVVKETRDLVRELNQLAATGAGYVGGGRNGPFKVALLERRTPGTSGYIFLDDNRAAKRFDKLVAAGYSYQGMMGGDLNCESEEMVSQKLVFAREAAGPTHQYKLLSLPEPKAGEPQSAALSELQRLAGEGFQVREIFYTLWRLHVILEK